MPVFADFNFDDTDGYAHDSAPLGGEQLGIYLHGAMPVGGSAVLDGQDDLVKIFPDPIYQMDQGTLNLSFSLGPDALSAPQTVLSRDAAGANAGDFRVEVLADGSVLVSHEGAGGTVSWQTAAGFAAPGDAVSLSYSWDLGGAGGALVLANATTGDGFSAAVPNTLSLEQEGSGSPWTIGAGQSHVPAGTLQGFDQFFQGAVSQFQISDSVDNAHFLDGIVSGFDSNDLIDIGYTGDPDGDRVDANDALLSGDGPNDDRIEAEAGNDTVLAGAGNDLVHGDAGDDSLSGEAGEDTLIGGQGNDTLIGGADNDRIDGGIDNDLIQGGAGADALSGGDDADTFVIGGAGEGAGDSVFGGSGGIDHDRLVLSGAGPYRLVDVVTDSDGNGIDGRVEFLDTDGHVTGGLNFSNIEEIVPCFTPGTLIATPRGEVLVEDLRVGDKVITRDDGLQEIRWLGHKDLSWSDLNMHAHLKPVLVTAGSLGDGLPERDMMVSPNHRMLVANDRTSLYFDEHEVLVAAKHLISGSRIATVDAAGLTYIHFMFDRHQVVLSNGAWTESFQPGDYSMKGIGNAQRQELFDLFPELKTDQGVKDYHTARRVLRRHEAVLLAH